MTAARRLEELRREIGAELVGDGDRTIVRVAPLDAAGPEDLSVFHHPRYREQFLATRAGAVIVGPSAIGSEGRPNCALLISDDPYLAFAKVARVLRPPRSPSPGIDSRAAVDPSAHVDSAAEVRAFAFVGAGAQVGSGTVLHSFSHVGDGARVGADCELHAGAVVEQGCVLGDRVILQAGAVVGSDGFGYAFDATAHLKVPQVGIARIEDDVEIGANSCVDRATMGETVVGRGTKIDNLVQVAHNVKIGPLSILCGQVGVAGSAQLGAGVILGGQVGISGHLSLGDGARVGAQSGVMHDVPAGETWSGYPALEHADWLRLVAAERQLVKRLAGRQKELSDLEKRLTALEQRLQSSKIT